MHKSDLPRLVVFGNPEKQHVVEAVDKFKAFAHGKALIVASYCQDDYGKHSVEGCDFAVVFGGDGAIISAARCLRHTNIPMIGVNLGKLGYLAEFSVSEVIEQFEDIISGKTPVEERMLLLARIFSDDKEVFVSTAVNDVFINSGKPFRAIDLKISIDSEKVAGCVSDGLIISTPTGSTAYSLSCGGPILSEQLQAFVITPISPHSLSFRPIVIKDTAVVEVRGIRVNEGTAVSMDGQVTCSLLEGQIVRIERHKGDFFVVNNPKRTQWQTLATKLRWAVPPKYKKIE
ncbi:MAG TPA: NAD(+)/NADH kinase [Sedimentisphaerales bacterium]|nr:NAD(+)/NADH kinase [Sedimentisphaerales bacterium]